MSEQTFVQGDTAPEIAALLKDADDVAIDLTDATVRFQMRKADDRRYTVNAAATIVTPATGSVKYSWGPNDLSVPGEYLAQWEITFSDGRIQTTDPPNEITVRRQ